jgi:hypothetical protein
VKTCRFGIESRTDLLYLAELGVEAQDYVLGYFQPSLAGLFLALLSTQDYPGFPARCSR